MNRLDSAAIVHICNLSDWNAAKEQGIYRAGSLATEGFIHCSTPTQVLATANRYYSGIRDLVLMWIDPSQLSSQVRWEASGTGIYPHVYGPINLVAVTAVLDFSPDKDGIFRSIPGIPRE